MSTAGGGSGGGSGGSGGFEELLAETRQLLSGAAGEGAGAGRASSSGNASSPGHPAEPVTGEGFDADRLVHVVVTAGGRVESVQVGERAMRLGSAEICERAIAAVNAALDDLQAKSAGQSAWAGVDPERLSRLQDASAAQMSNLVTGLADLMKSFGR